MSEFDTPGDPSSAEAGNIEPAPVEGHAGPMNSVISAYLLGAERRPTQITIYGITGGAELWLRIPLDLSLPPLTLVVQSLAVVRQTPHVPFFGPVTGFVINYTPDRSVRFDTNGDPVEVLERPFVPGQVAFSIGRKPVSTEALCKALSSMPTAVNGEQ